MKIEVKKIEGGVTAAKGFQAASTAAQIKYQGRTDMAMIYSKSPCAAAGTFTGHAQYLAGGPLYRIAGLRAVPSGSLGNGSEKV